MQPIVPGHRRLGHRPRTGPPPATTAPPGPPSKIPPPPPNPERILWMNSIRRRMSSGLGPAVGVGPRGAGRTPARGRRSPTRLHHLAKKRRKRLLERLGGLVCFSVNTATSSPASRLARRSSSATTASTSFNIGPGAETISELLPVSTPMVILGSSPCDPPLLVTNSPPVTSAAHAYRGRTLPVPPGPGGNCPSLATMRLE